MQWGRGIFVIFLLPLLIFSECHAAQAKWIRENIDITDSNLTCIASDSKENILYVGSQNHLYKRCGNDAKWQGIFTTKGEEKGINDIFITDNSIIYIATKDGIYRSCNYGEDWQEFLRNKDFETDDIGSIAYDGDKDYFYILTASKLYKLKPDTTTWTKIFKGTIPEEITEELEESEDEYFALNKVRLDNENNIYLSTNRGIFKSIDEGKSWKKLPETGLIDNNINFCLISDNDEIYAATEGGVFKYDEARKEWSDMYEGLLSRKAKYLNSDSNSIFCLSNNIIYSNCDKKRYVKTLYSDFNNEPSIRTVQKMAISYAEVHPDKIKNWRKLAQIRAALPKVTFGIDNSASDTYEIYTSSTTNYAIAGPRDYSEGWDITFTWDLADLVYNEHQTSIDVRSKLLVQLREDILNEVTRLYFERRRLQIELTENKSRSESKIMQDELRLQELTASIDALTGGEFSDAIQAE